MFISLIHEVTSMGTRDEQAFLPSLLARIMALGNILAKDKTNFLFHARHENHEGLPHLQQGIGCQKAVVPKGCFNSHHKGSQRKVLIKNERKRHSWHASTATAAKKNINLNCNQSECRVRRRQLFRPRRVARTWRSFVQRSK